MFTCTATEKLVIVCKAFVAKCKQNNVVYTNVISEQVAIDNWLPSIFLQCSAVDSNGFKLKPYLEQINK